MLKFGIYCTLYKKRNLMLNFLKQIFMAKKTKSKTSPNIGNEVATSDQNYNKLQLNSIVSNDIETVNINGLI